MGQSGIPKTAAAKLSDELSKDFIGNRYRRNHTLLVEFDNKAKRLYDIRPLFEKEPFSLLKNFSFFKAVMVDKGGFAVYWNQDIDLSEFEIWRHGKPA